MTLKGASIPSTEGRRVGSCATCDLPSLCVTGVWWGLQASVWVTLKWKVRVGNVPKPISPLCGRLSSSVGIRMCEEDLLRLKPPLYRADGEEFLLTPQVHESSQFQLLRAAACSQEFMVSSASFSTVSQGGNKGGCRALERASNSSQSISQQQDQELLCGSSYRVCSLSDVILIVVTLHCSHLMRSWGSWVWCGHNRVATVWQYQ